MQKNKNSKIISKCQLSGHSNPVFNINDGAQAALGEGGDIAADNGQQDDRVLGHPFKREHEAGQLRAAAALPRQGD